MANAAQFNITTDAAAQDVADHAAATPRHSDQMHGWRPHGILATRQEITINGGKITSAAVHDKTFGVPTGYADQPRPGFIKVPGMGETTVDAAKAAGLIPHNWMDGDRLPFEDAPKEKTEGAGKGAQDGTDKGEGDKPRELTVPEHRAEVAGQILDRADKELGAEATDAFISNAVETGELPEEGLPSGFTSTMVQQVYQGYVAQADAVLSPVGASVSLLQEMLSDDELRQARQYTIAKSGDDLAQLGRVAVDRLATMPQTDPEGFLEMLADMPAKERRCLRHDRRSGDWIVTVPGHPEMSFGAAVRLGLVRV